MASAPLLESAASSSNEEKRGGGGCLERVLDVEEAKKQLWHSCPLILTNFSYYAMALVAVMFDGHLGDVELAGSTLGNSWATVTGFTLMVGLSGSLETLCGQAYGAGLYRMLGIYLQASIITNTIVSILVSVTWYFTEPILIWVHQQPSVARAASVYLRFLIPGIFAMNAS